MTEAKTSPATPAEFYGAEAAALRAVSLLSLDEQISVLRRALRHLEGVQDQRRARNKRVVEVIRDTILREERP